MKNYEAIVEEEALREIASWPEGSEFETLEPMMRITLNIILRAIFGADGAELETLRRIIPPWVTYGFTSCRAAHALPQLRALESLGQVGQMACITRSSTR